VRAKHDRRETPDRSTDRRRRSERVRHRQQEKSNRESLITFIGDEVGAVRRRQYRIYPKEFTMTTGNPPMTGLAGQADGVWAMNLSCENLCPCDDQSNLNGKRS
jgi:hypothetical protein